MAYQSSKPQITIDKDIAQSDILNNFQSYEIAWTFDHTDLDSASNGFHKRVTLYNLDDAPSVDTNDIGLYLSNDSIFFKRATPNETFALGDFASSDNLIGITFTRGAWFESCGLLYKSFNRIAINDQTGSFTVTLGTVEGAPLFTSIYTVLVTPVADNNGTDSNADILVTGWTITAIAETINIRIWRRDQDGTAGTNHPPVLFNLLIIGK